MKSLLSLTALESAMIVKIAHSEYNAVNGRNPKCSYDTDTYINMVVETQEDKGVFSSLIKKELVYSTVVKSGSDDNTCMLSDQGFQAYLEIIAQPEPPTTKKGDTMCAFLEQLEDSATHPYISMSSGVIPDTSAETHLINQHGELVPLTNEDSSLRWAHWIDSRCDDDPHYCSTTTFHCLECGARWDREEYTGGSVIRGAKCNC